MKTFYAFKKDDESEEFETRMVLGHSHGRPPHTTAMPFCTSFFEAENFDAAKAKATKMFDDGEFEVLGTPYSIFSKLSMTAKYKLTGLAKYNPTPESEG
jgi:hypothetical protein